MGLDNMYNNEESRPLPKLSLVVEVEAQPLPL